ncbi:MAG: hypothetical protein GXY77_00330 [Fibrobacter sp.]|nr:hypothetical protein [Fibrobacter sp.]
MNIECKLNENRKKCTCPEATCKRYGACCECVAYHRENGNLPHCLKKNK